VFWISYTHLQNWWHIASFFVRPFFKCRFFPLILCITCCKPPHSYTMLLNVSTRVRKIYVTNNIEGRGGGNWWKLYPLFSYHQKNVPINFANECRYILWYHRSSLQGDEVSHFWLRKLFFHDNLIVLRSVLR